MYKVPVMMILAERYKAGEITDETKISGLTLAEANELILVYSHNDYAHAMMHYIGTDAECRTLYQQYAQLPAEYYVQDFYDYSYFTARFMTQVMQTLYTEQERFPNVVEHLLLAQPGQYFKAGITDVPVAQKYGNFMDSMGRQFTHDTGIVYTDNPFILTVMTKNMGASDTVIRRRRKKPDVSPKKRPDAWPRRKRPPLRPPPRRRHRRSRRGRAPTPDRARRKPSPLRRPRQPSSLCAPTGPGGA